MPLPNNIRNLQLSSGDPGSYLTLGRQQSQQVAEQVPQSQAFNLALVNLLTQYQQLGTASIQNAQLSAQEQQAQRIQETPQSLIGAAPSVQSGVREAAAQALQPTITGLGQQQKTFGEQIRSFGDVLNVARTIGDQMAEQEQKAKDELRKNIDFYISQGGTQAIENLLSNKEGLDVIKKSGLDANTLKSSLTYMRQKESQEKQKQSLELMKLQDEIAKLQQEAKFGKPPTAQQEVVSTYASRIEQSIPTIENLEKDIRNMSLFKFEAQMRLPASLQSSKIQQYMQASRNFINAVLRRESGAVINPDEFVQARQQYLPQPGDTEATLKLKKQNRDVVFKTFQKGAGSAYQPLNELLEGQTIQKGGRTFKVIK